MEEEAGSPPQAQEKKDEGALVSYPCFQLSFRPKLTIVAANKRIAPLPDLTHHETSDGHA